MGFLQQIVDLRDWVELLWGKSFETTCVRSCAWSLFLFSLLVPFLGTIRGVWVSSLRCLAADCAGSTRDIGGEAEKGTQAGGCKKEELGAAKRKAILYEEKLSKKHKDVQKGMHRTLQGSDTAE